jgi:hypothetical protein
MGPEPGTSCCLARRKLVVGILAVLPEEECGVSNTEIAEFIRFDLKTPKGTPVISFRYCPWCGTERALGTETRITEHIADVEELELEDESNDADTQAWEDDE